jgi:hypothetical protein
MTPTAVRLAVLFLIFQCITDVVGASQSLRQSSSSNVQVNSDEGSNLNDNLVDHQDDQGHGTANGEGIGLGLGFANPSTSPSITAAPSTINATETSAPSFSSAPSMTPTVSSAPSQSQSPSLANGTTATPSSVADGNETTYPSTSPSPSVHKTTAKPSMRYTTTPTQAPTTAEDKGKNRKKTSFLHKFFTFLGWTFLIFLIFAVASYAYLNRSQIRFTLIEFWYKVQALNIIHTLAEFGGKAKRAVVGLALRVTGRGGDGASGGYNDDGGDLTEGLLLRQNT